MRIAILGPGAIGGSIAAHLAQDAGHEVIVLARSPFESLVVETPEGALAASVTVCVEPNALEARAFDWVLVATKTYDVPSAAPWFTALAGDSRVAVLQNGVEHAARLAPWVEGDRILPVVVELSASRSGPGRLRQRGRACLTVPAGESGRAFAGLFSQTKVEVVVTSDFTTAAWRKLCLNCAGAVPALLARPNAIVRNEGVAAIVRAAVAECIAVGRAEGAVLDDALAEEVTARLGASDSKNSLTADRIAGRPMEVDARNGVIVRLGARHGIPTPTNSLLCTLLDALQPG